MSAVAIKTFFHNIGFSKTAQRPCAKSPAVPAVEGLQSDVFQKTQTVYSTNILNDKTGKKEDVSIQHVGTNPQSHKEEWVMYDKSGAALGYIKFRPVILREESSKDAHPTEIDSQILKDTMEKGCIEVGNLEGGYKKRGNVYRGIGSRLIQLAVERGIQEGYRGRICLDSQKGSYIFYKKIGLDIARKNHKEKVEEYIKKYGSLDVWEGNDVPVQAGKMFLTQKGLDDFIEKIEEDAITTSNLTAVP